MASTALHNGTANGTAAPGGPPAAPVSKRFSDIPSTIEIPVGGDEDDEAVELDAEELGEDPREVCQLLEQEHVARTYWMTVALAYAKQRRMDHAIETLSRGGNALQGTSPQEKLSMIGCLCWMYLWKSREAPRVVTGEDALVSEAKTKDYYLKLATTTLNEASRINPAFPPLFLARGVLQLLRASLQSPSGGSSGPASAVDADKAELLRHALKSFDDSIRVSHGKNMLAVMGKARALYSLQKYPEALAAYQEVLQKMPDLIDPDPRIGIGCCFWQLGHKEDARMAWERCLEINPESKHAHILLGLFYLDASSHVPTNSPEFIRLYKKAMTDHTQKSFKLDRTLPLTSVTFANYFLSRKTLDNVDSLSHRAIQYTDVNAIASDGWYLLARKEHLTGDASKARDYYRRADDARGGADRGYLPAKFGVAQLSVMKNDLGEAKLLLEKMVQQSRNHEAMVLLGTLYAEEVFGDKFADKDERAAALKKATQYLENAKASWADPKKGLLPDACVLLNLARLYEAEHPDKALQCLLQVEQLELAQIPESEHPEDQEDKAAVKSHLRKFLPPQLLNNIGCFYYQQEKHDLASELFQAALSACVKIEETDRATDTDALVTTISFNLGRSYEARGMSSDAVEVYEGLLERHGDYTDALTRLAYIKLIGNPSKEGPAAVSKLQADNPTDLEVRALYGWFLSRVPQKKLSNVVEDQEFRYYKHTLQQHDKHDRYALVGMGNLYLKQAREMRRQTEQEKQKRSAIYSKAVEFFDKALQLDGKNAYAAQGVAIALAEDKKDSKTALPIFLKVRESVRDAHVFVNLGHIFAELRQFTKAIENYEIALSKEGRSKDALILSCLGRVWLNKGKADKDLDSFHKALDCARKAHEASPESIYNKFNVAFVQIELANTILNMSETHRTAKQLQEASDGLEAAISALEEIASQPNPPYPKNELEQRTTMSKNTTRKKMERAMASQREYEEKNKEKLQAALAQREAEIQRRKAERELALEKERLRQEQIKKDREQIIARDREVAERRAEEERERIEAEMTTDEEGNKVKRKRRPAPRAAGDGSGSRAKKSSRRKKKAGSDDESEEEEEPKHANKKRRLTAKENSKYKSAEIIENSDDDDDDDNEGVNARASNSPEKRRQAESSEPGSPRAEPNGMDVDARDDDEDDDATARRPQRRARGRIVDESDEDDDGNGDEEVGGGGGRAQNGASDDEDEGSPPPAGEDTKMAGADDDDDE